MGKQNYNDFLPYTTSKLINDGVLSFLTNLASVQKQDQQKLREYLELGANSDEISIEEEVTRLLTIASLDNCTPSPVENITNSVCTGGISSINSLFLTSVLNKTTLFETEYDNLFTKGSFNNLITDIDKASTTGNQELIDSVLTKITAYYSKHLDQSILSKKLDLRYYEPLLNWFEYTTGIVKEKIKGEKMYENKGKYQ